MWEKLAAWSQECLQSSPQAARAELLPLRAGAWHVRKQQGGVPCAACTIGCRQVAVSSTWMLQIVADGCHQECKHLLQRGGRPVPRLAQAQEGGVRYVHDVPEVVVWHAVVFQTHLRQSAAISHERRHQLCSSLHPAQVMRSLVRQLRMPGVRLPELGAKTPRPGIPAAKEARPNPGCFAYCTYCQLSQGCHGITQWCSTLHNETSMSGYMNACVTSAALGAQTPQRLQMQGQQPH